MNFLMVVCLVGYAMASPQQRPTTNDQDVLVLKSDISPINGATFRYLYQLDNGIFAEKEGIEGFKGQSNFVGSYSFQSPEGETIEVRYRADETGFHPESASIPVPPPLPAHSLEQIRIGEQLRAEGVRFDDQGFKI